MPPRVQGRSDRPWRFFAIAIVLINAVLFYKDSQGFRNTTAQLDGTRDLQEQTNRVIASVTDAEDAQRGYLLTGNPEFLTAFKDASQQVPGELADLEESARTHTGDQKKHTDTVIGQVRHMGELAKERLASAQRVIEARDTAGYDAAVALIRADQGRLEMQNLRGVAREINSGEELRLNKLENEADANGTSLNIIVMAGSLALIFLLWRIGTAVDAVVREREDLAAEIDESRQQLETTLASIGDAVIVTNATGEIRFMNPVAENLTGWRFEDCRDRALDSVLKLIDDASGQPIQNSFALLNGQVGMPEHLVLAARGGSEKPVEESSAPIKDNGGNNLGLVVVLRDVTARRSAERDLKRWKETFSSAGFGMFLAEAKTGNIIDLNPTFASMHGYSVDELLNKPLSSLVQGDFVSKLAESLHTAIEKGRNMFEETHVRRDGSVFPGFVDVTRFYIGRAQYLAGYCSDITERKRFEDAIRESEERFRTLADALPQLIWSANSRGEIDYVNQMWFSYAGWKSEEESRKYLPQAPWQDLLHVEDRDEYFRRWKASLDTGNTFEMQVRLRRAADGSYRWFLCRAVSVRDRNGKVVRWLGGCTDIQQQMQDSAQLKAAVKALQQSNADLEQFAYAASHDLQEPLRMVSIYSELLQEEYGGNLDQQASSYIDFAVNGARRMSHLLKGLLEFSRVANASPQISAESDATSALRTAMLNLESVIEENHASIEVGVLPMVKMSEVHLVQLFQNLIGNAIKYRKEEGPDAEHPVIRINAKPDSSGKWLFSVADNGMGIEPEYLTQIFGIFKRLHGSTIDGTGIGLALCQKIVERAGGRIWAESEPGKGSTFFFTLQGVETGDHALAYHNFAGRG